MRLAADAAERSTPRHRASPSDPRRPERRLGARTSVDPRTYVGCRSATKRREENIVVRILSLFFAACCCILPRLGFADDAAKELVGTWKLLSSVVSVDGGERSTFLVKIRKGSYSSLLMDIGQLSLLARVVHLQKLSTIRPIYLTR
jgi:hypothetical protein